MAKQYEKKFIILALVAASCGDVSDTERDPDIPRDAGFAPDPFRFEEPDYEDVGPVVEAEIVKDVEFDDGSIVRFIDQTPADAVPSIGLVLVESTDATSRLNIMFELGMSPLEFYYWLDPEAVGAPEPLEREHLARRAEPGLSDEPRRFAASTGVADDTWVPDCGSYNNASDLAAWSSDFNSWSQQSSAHSNGVFGNSGGRVKSDCRWSAAVV